MLQSRQQSIQRETRDAWSEWSKSDWAYFPAMNDDPNESIIDLEIKKGIEWKIAAWSNLLFVGHRCFNQCIDLSSEKWKSELNIEGWWSLLLRAQRWSNPIETTIILEGNKGIGWDIEGRSSLPVSDDWPIKFNGDNYQPRERNKDLNKSSLSDRIYFSGTEWVLYSMWCNERWWWGYIHFWFVRVILHCPPAALFRRNHSISVNLVHEGHSLLLTRK